MTTKANCILLNVRGKYYYAEELGKFIEIENWEYDRILNDPNLYYFSTALKKHFEWCAAVGKASTLTFPETLGQTHSVSGKPEGQTISPAEANKTGSEPSKVTLKPVALFLRALRNTIELFQLGPTKWTFLCVAIAAVTAFVGYNSRAANYKVPSYSTVSRSPEIRRAIPVEPEIRRAIPVGPEIRKAIPVQADPTRGDL